MHPVVVPILFNLQHVLRCRLEGTTMLDEDIFVIGLLMVVVVACLVQTTNTTTGWCFTLPPLLLLLIGTFYQRIRSFPEDRM